LITPESAIQSLVSYSKPTIFPRDSPLIGLSDPFTIAGVRPQRTVLQAGHPPGLAGSPRDQRRPCFPRRDRFLRRSLRGVLPLGPLAADGTVRTWRGSWEYWGPVRRRVRGAPAQAGATTTAVFSAFLYQHPKGVGASSLQGRRAPCFLRSSTERHHPHEPLRAEFHRIIDKRRRRSTSRCHATDPDVSGADDEEPQIGKDPRADRPALPSLHRDPTQLVICPGGTTCPILTRRSLSWRPRLPIAWPRSPSPGALTKHR